MDAIGASERAVEQARGETLRKLDQRRKTVLAKQDRAYEDFLDLHVRSRNSRTYLTIRRLNLLVKGNRPGDWRAIWDEFRNALIQA